MTARASLIEVVGNVAHLFLILLTRSGERLSAGLVQGRGKFRIVRPIHRRGLAIGTDSPALHDDVGRLLQRHRSSLYNLPPRISTGVRVGWFVGISHRRLLL